jgi:hypothetical protein
MALLAKERALAWIAVRVWVELHSLKEPHAREGHSQRSLDGLCEVGKARYVGVAPAAVSSATACGQAGRVRICQLVPTNPKVGLDLAQVGREAEGAAVHEAVGDGS